ncbi:MAG: M48 family metallopeptidase [Puniceicoccales bacterium]|jgi:predicted metal-dependent hydrolase|nr:M48 family metallopeptidase [Puniceicoccales bacterium]
MSSEATESLELSGKGGVFVVNVEWRESPRARRLNLVVPRSGPVRLVLPRGMGREDALVFLREKREWLRRALARRPAGADAAVPLVADYLARSPWVCIEGCVRPLVCAGTPYKPFLLHRNVNEPVFLGHRRGEAHEADLRFLLRLLAAETLPRHVLALAQRVGVRVSELGIRDQRRRWGSCSDTGRLSLNWRLVLLPPALQDHIIYHELAHRLEMNHSERFWDLLFKWDPESGLHDRALRHEWGGLMDLAR